MAWEGAPQWCTHKQAGAGSERCVLQTGRHTRAWVFPTQNLAEKPARQIASLLLHDAAAFSVYSIHRVYGNVLILRKIILTIQENGNDMGEL